MNEQAKPIERSATEWAAMILRFLEAQGRACAPAEIIAATGCPAANVRRILTPMLDDGRIVSAGTTARRRYGVPGANLDHRATARPPRVKGIAKPKPKPSRLSDAERLQAGIDHALSQGASVDAARLRRQLVADVPTVTVDQVTAALEQRWREGIVERIYVTDSQIRYRKLAKVRKMVAAA